MKRVMLSLGIVAVLAAVVLIYSCGGGGSSSDPETVTITLSPVDAATNQAVNVSVTAAFSGDITEPSAEEWLTKFLLKAAGSDENLCTEVNYLNHVATCTHANLTAGTTYTITITGVLDASGTAIADATASFTTADSLEVASVTKTSALNTTAGNLIALTFNFTEAVPEGITPEVTVGDVSADISASAKSMKTATLGDCEFSADRLSYTCGVSGIDGCNTFTDYSFSIAANGTTFNGTFNSADAEYESQVLFTNGCLGTQFEGDSASKMAIAIDETNGVLQYTFSNPGSGVGGRADKDISITGDFAIISYLSYNNVTSTTGTQNAGALRIKFVDGDSTELTSGHMGAPYDIDFWFVLSGIEPNQNFASPGGDLSDYSEQRAPFYTCIVRKDNAIKYFISFDGETFTELTTSNMVEVGVGTVAGAINPTISSEASDIWLFVNNQVDGATDYKVEYDYLRFKTTGITGTSDDCNMY